MKPNINTKGRLIRAILSILILGVGAYGYFSNWPFWICAILLLAGLFIAFEAVKGWCLARACGIKTRF